MVSALSGRDQRQSASAARHGSRVSVGYAVAQIATGADEVRSAILPELAFVAAANAAAGGAISDSTGAVH